MHLSRFISRGILVVALLALAMPLVALADSGKRDRDDRTFLATDTAGNLLSFSSDNPRKTRSKRITGLPAMVTIKGIDFRPASGDLYALGSDRLVYRLNPRTAIAVPDAVARSWSLPAARSFGRVGVSGGEPAAACEVANVSAQRPERTSAADPT